ncbi:MAG TPA: CapA family protein, partial [Candidatus Paceibacterota bacterium]|nr:CapA family protein [Candidatus Paceibacterota bacterium]
MEWVTALIGFIVGLVASILPGHTFGYHALPLQDPHATILFVGDMMFDRSIRTKAEEKGGDYLFSCVDPLLTQVDTVVGNLEGPITASSSKSVGSEVGAPDNFTFTFATSTAELLVRHHIGLVSIGNNHIMNFGRDGLTQTKHWLTAAGVGYFGDPDAGEAERVARVTIGGIAFSFVNWSDWTSDNTDITVGQIRTEAQSGRVVVVYNHWGDEYVPPPARVKELAHEMVDAGAAIVIGS